jgi:hypothetical protein
MQEKMGQTNATEQNGRETKERGKKKEKRASTEELCASAYIERPNVKLYSDGMGWTFNTSSFVLHLPFCLITRL